MHTLPYNIAEEYTRETNGHYLVTFLKDSVSVMTYTVSSGTLNPSIPYHTILKD